MSLSLVAMGGILTVAGVTSVYVASIKIPYPNWLKEDRFQPFWYYIWSWGSMALAIWGIILLLRELF